MNETVVLVNGSTGLTHLDVLFSQFPDGDLHCLIEGIEVIKNKDVLVIHDLYPDQNNQIIKMIILIALLKNEGAKSISVFTPYLPYSRQDKKHLPGEAASLDVICKTISDAGCNSLYVVDCHFMKGESTTIRAGLRINNYTLSTRLIDDARRIMGSSFDLIGPDQGANYLIGGTGESSMHKVRGDYKNLDNGSRYRDIISIDGGHITTSNDNLIIIDDMISTGSTMIKAIESLKRDQTKRIYCIVTHGLFLGDSYQRLKELTEELIFSDTVKHPESKPLTEALIKETVVPDWLKRC